MAHTVAELDRERPSAGEAFRLAEQGDLTGAIEVGTVAARSQADMELLGALARWRHDAFLRQTHPPGLPSWPPSLPDPFPGAQGVPGIDAQDLTAEILGGAIVHHGSLHVRGLIPHAVAETLQRGIDRALAAQQCAMAHEPIVDPGWFVPYNVPEMVAARHWPHGANAMFTADSPPMLQALIDALGASGVVDRIAEFMGERPALSIAKSTLRRQTAVPTSGWHQDGAFLGRQVRSVNVWLALSDCGTTAPGMDVVGRRLPYVVQTNSHGAAFDWSVGEGMVDILAQGGAPVQTPDFEAGDALLFDHLMLHRTSLKPGATGTRWAIESWFFAPTDYPYDRVPLLV